MLNPLVSVIIPTYNCEKYINKTIQSVGKQTYTNWEIIVIDDCSTDGTLEKIKEIQKKEKNRISILSTKKNSGGPARPRNLGIQKSKGELIAFLDGDDLWHEKKIEKQVEYYNQYYQEGGARNKFFCHAGYYELKKGKKKRNLKAKLIKFRQDYHSLFKNDFIGTLAVVIHRSLLTKNMFREDAYLSGVEDYDLWLTIIKEGVKINYLMESLAYYRIRDDSIIQRSSMMHATKNLNLILEHLARDDSMSKIPQLKIIVPHLWYYIKSYIKYKISK